MHTFLKSMLSRSPFKGTDETLHTFYKIGSDDIWLDVLSDTTLLNYTML
jgi:hypothetical protein